MLPLTALPLTESDWAAWLSAAGTWFIGAVAGTIAYKQYRHGTAARNPKYFKPRIVSVLADLDRRVLIQLVNEGPASGVIAQLDVLPPMHQVSGALESYRWDIDGMIGDKEAIPFLLEGYASAELVIEVLGESPMLGLAVRIDYSGPAQNRQTDCTKVSEVLQYPLAHTTHVRPGPHGLL
jgi:hypothetical protein